MITMIHVRARIRIQGIPTSTGTLCCRHDVPVQLYEASYEQTWLGTKASYHHVPVHLGRHDPRPIARRVSVRLRPESVRKIVSNFKFTTERVHADSLTEGSGRFQRLCVGNVSLGATKGSDLETGCRNRTLLSGVGFRNWFYDRTLGVSLLEGGPFTQDDTDLMTLT